MFLNVIKIQKLIRREYLGDGHTGIRNMNIINIKLLSVITILRIAYFIIMLIISNETNDLIATKIIYYGNTLMIFVISFFNYKFYKGNEFKFLSKK